MVGTIVRPIAGHDSGTLCLVMAEEDGYLFLADGKRRRISKPKRKKQCHVKAVDTSSAVPFGDGLPMSDRELRKMLAIFRDQFCAEIGGN